jgi:dolichol-phosphate mannosyltransferase
MKKVLVTGGSGFVGANLARRLLSEGHEVHLLMRPHFSDWRLRDIRPHVAIHVANLARSDEVDGVLQRIKPAWVFHLAAYGAYSFQDDAEEVIRTNCLGTMTLIQACLKIGIEILVHAGSSSEYGFKDHAPAETELAEPNSAYAVAKAAATQFCRLTARTRHVPLTTLRLYSAYGAFEDPRRLIPTLIVHALDGRWPRLAGPETARDFVHVEDVIDAFLAVARNPPADPGAIYNVGSGRQTTLQELVALTAAQFRIEQPPVWNSLPPRAWDTDVWVSNPAKIKAEVGWSAKTTLPQGLRLLADWLQSDPRRMENYREPMPARTSANLPNDR